MRILIADDEKMARKRLARLLDALGGHTLTACRDGEEALAALDPARIDVAILDIDMPGMNGLQTAELAHKRGIPVIFVTAHEQHAVEAFRQHAVHFLLKPIDAPRLAEALERITPEGTRVKRLALRVGDDAVLVDVAAITHALYDGALVTVHVGDAQHLSDRSLQELLDQLAGPFLRVHRRAIVNLDRVVRLESLPSGGYTAHLDNGGEAPVSRAAARDLRKRLGL